MSASHRHGRTWATALVLVLTALCIQPEPLQGQYFGRNKVQYRTFDFQVLKTPNFDIYYYPEEEEAVRDAARMAERWYARLSRILDHRFEQRQPLVLYANHPHFQQTTTYAGGISEGTGGFTEAFKQRVVMPFTHSYAETDHVLGHELVHAFQYDITGMGRAGGGLEAAARRSHVPLWFSEGMAEYLSVGPVDPLTGVWIRDAALQGEMPSIDRMTRDPRVFPYRWGHALWAYVGGRWGDAVIGQILKLTGQGVPYSEAFERILNISLDELSGDWQTALRRAYLPLLTESGEAREIARPLINANREGGRMNVGPSLSPDGRYVAFLSELDFLDVELHLADAHTGEVIRRLQKGTAFDPHFGSLRYINSAGTWSPDGSQFAFAALREGRDVVVILDVERSRRLREIEVPGVGEIMNPNWSPDGTSIVFSGLAGGLTNLYLLDLESGDSRKLTNDRYTQLHPVFSPDGARIAYVTERGPGTDLDLLQYGTHRLAILDIATGVESPVPSMSGWRNINPQWTRDGAGLYFISDRSGIPNAYRVDLESGALFQITNLFTGITGITAVSPALTVAANDDRLIFAAMEAGGYNLYTLTESSDLAGIEVPEVELAAADTVIPIAALLPPIPRPREAAFNRVAQLLADPRFGLPDPDDAAAYAVVPYSPRLSLDYLGQPQVGVAVGGPFGGTGFHGGVAGIFSDVLGRHTVAGYVQAQGQLDEIGFATQYINTGNRWNLGAMVQRMPYIRGYYGFGVDTIRGMPVNTQDLIRLRFFDSNLMGFAQYPISTVQRLELSAGLRRIAADFQLFRIPFDGATGRILGNGYMQREPGFAYNMAQASAAIVYDNSLMSYTSPFAGQRYRFEISPTVGHLTFVQALADYRRYFFMRPFTLAVRGLHSGRYGAEGLEGSAEQQVLRDQYLGYPWLVRGYYDVYGSCVNSGGVNRDCEILPNLFGNRIGIAAAEIRFPLIRYLVLGTSLGFPPIEGFGFFDAGTAWSGSTTPRLQRGTDGLGPAERGILTSGGVGARVNLFGYMIAEFNYVNAFERRDGWRWQFNFQPGF
ncbi:basic secretory protein-like protein [soil metagenome]